MQIGSIVDAKTNVVGCRYCSVTESFSDIPLYIRDYYFFDPNIRAAPTYYEWGPDMF